MNNPEQTFQNINILEKISSLSDLVARIATGEMIDINREIPEYLNNDTDPFNPVFQGIFVLLNDVIRGREEIELQKRFNELRVNMWKLASDELLSEAALIERLLSLTGAILKVSHASFLRFNKEVIECIYQWTSPGISLTDSSIEKDWIKDYIGTEFFSSTLSTYNKLHPAFAEKLKQYGIVSFVGVPYGPRYNPEGIFSFTECTKERIWSPFEIGVLIEMSHIAFVRATKTKAQTALEESKNKLEEIVRERTIELATTNSKLRDDIKERERIQQALGAEKERLAVTLRSIAEAVLTCDNKGNIILCNKAVEHLTGYKCSDLEQKHFDSVISVYDEQTGKKIENFLSLILEKTNSGLIETRCIIKSRSGSERIITYQGALLSNTLSEQIGTVVVMRDITDRLKMETELQRASKLESIGILAGGIAHDFNNILTGIITNLFVSRLQIQNQSDAYRLLLEAEKAAFRATKLTKQLLTFSKGGTPIKESASIREIIEETSRFCLSGSNVKCSILIDDQISSVEIDKGQIEQVFQNLIINALQAMPHGGYIEISAENYSISSGRLPQRTSHENIPLSPGDYVKVQISDEGIGISTPNLNKIFDPYFTTKPNGSGLGLAITYSIIKKHGGYIEVESVVNKGTTFTFYLPAVKTMPQTNKSIQPKEIQGKGQVLILEDDPIVRKVIENLLKRLGFDVCSTSKGEDAIQAYKDSVLQEEKFVFVIMDLTIPGGLGGKECIRPIKEIDKNAKVIVSSGYNNDPVMAQYRSFGFDGVLPKPFSMEEFTKTIDEILNS